MSITNKERVGRAMDRLQPELFNYVQQELRASYEEEWESRLAPGDGVVDVQRLCSTILNEWDTVFGRLFPRDGKSTVYEVRKWRNKHAHQEPFESTDTLNALIDIKKLLEAIVSIVAEEVETSMKEVMLAQLDTGAMKVQKRTAQAALKLEIPGLRPWREVMEPHEDVAMGRFQQAEFAADLWQVYNGKGADEYRDPRAFFARTLLTEGLRKLLINALQRFSGIGGDPVVELKINFGGGKTHSMLALYHLFGGQAMAVDLPGVESVLNACEVSRAPSVKRAVIVGTSMRPGSPIAHDDGITTRTLWGEIAWQLAGKEGFELVRAADETATNPGDLLDALFEVAGPSLILIDEWVAYARQLFDRQKMLPAGDFDTQFTFAQTLCEAARRAGNVLVCISIPASERDGIVSMDQAGDVAGRTAMERLQDAVGRSNMVWRPATSEESFEIVSRRLFKPIAEDMIDIRGATVREFTDLYKANPNEFPSECRESGYARRMIAAYPIHPEVFDRLYSDWSTLEKFQRTRGVLRLMASVIHWLWANGDGGALIMPASIPLSDPAVQAEVTRYLSERWSAVIDRDVDGPNSTPMQLEAERASTYGRYSACRRVARTVFMGSAPVDKAANRGIDERRIKLGSVQPKETIATFADALAKLRQRATYLYNADTRYWYQTQASVNREAQDRAGGYTPEQVNTEIVLRLRQIFTAARRGEFAGAHIAANSSDIPDDRALRLVVLGPSAPHKNGKHDTLAERAAAETLERRGSAPRINRNRLVFLAADADRYAELDTAGRDYLAWRSIQEDSEANRLDLDISNREQAKARLNKSDSEMAVKLGEVYCIVLSPYQGTSTTAHEWFASRIPGQIDQVTTRLIKKLETEQHLMRSLGGKHLRLEMDRIPLWRDDRHVSVAQLQEDFAQRLYLPRLLKDDVLFGAVKEGAAMLSPEFGFAYADAYDPTSDAYARLRFGAIFQPGQNPFGWLVKPEVAFPLIDVEATPAVQPIPPKPPLPTSGSQPPLFDGDEPGTDGTTTSPPPSRPTKRRFHGTIELEVSSFRERAGDLSREIAAQLAKVVGSNVRITVEVTAEAEQGFDESLQRTVNENCRTLKFESFEFEED